MGDVIPFHGRPSLPEAVSREDAATLVREVIEDSARIIWTQHALDRMWDRGISDRQVLQVLRRGEVITDPSLSDDRNWKFTMEADTAGDIVRVVLALDTDRMGNFVVVITVIAA
ncbi:DUF4258 domain-containing protein [Rhodanobacter aciditrophus]|uniref:DUF4258 domain-containing protein n=1 Tax=Rhodanobacter aciditrophus TaxID=1623218 RepID=UPI003CF76010